MKKIIILILIILSLRTNAGLNEWMPFEIIEGKYTFPISIEGVKSKASYNTGTFNTKANETFLINNDIEFKNKVFMSITLNKENLRLKKPPHFKNDSPIGIELGSLIFHNRIFQVNHSKKEIRFFKRRQVDLYKTENLKIRSRTKETTALAAEVFINNDSFFFDITSPRASYTVISNKLAKEKGWLENFLVQTSNLDGNLKKLSDDYNVMKIPNFQIGPYEFDFLIVLASKLDTKNDLIYADLDGFHSNNRYYDGILGQDALSNFLITYDPFKRKAHLKLAE